MGTEAASDTTTRAAVRWQTAILRRITPRTSRVKSFYFELPRPFDFLAGQHVDVRLTAPDGYQVQRSYSIASAPQMPGLLELTIERLDDGEVSPFFHDVAVIGDEIELRGPFGGYFIWSAQWSNPERGPVVLVGGGSGVVPLMSIVRHRFERQSRTPMVLLFSARTWDDVIYRDELLALADRNDGFELAITLTRDKARRSGDYARRIDAGMARETLARVPGAPTQVYVCGSNPFVEAAAQSLLDAQVPSERIRIERYGGVN